MIRFNWFGSWRTWAHSPARTYDWWPRTRAYSWRPYDITPSCTRTCTSVKIEPRSLDHPIASPIRCVTSSTCGERSARQSSSSVEHGCQFRGTSKDNYSSRSFYCFPSRACKRQYPQLNIQNDDLPAKLINAPSMSHQVNTDLHLESLEDDSVVDPHTGKGS